MSEESADKPHEATPRKLDEARKRGEIPKVTDLTATAALAGLLALALLPGGWVPLRLGETGAAMLDRADLLSSALLGGGVAAAGTILQAVLVAIAPAFVVPLLAVIAVLTGLRAVVFAPSRLEPKLSRISPVAIAGQKFGPSGLFEFAKNLVKLTIIGAVLWAYVLSRLPRMLATPHQAPGPATAEMLRMMAEFLALVVVVMAVLALLDHLWQVFDHRRRQRMSHQELREEFRQSEGDPLLKQTRRQRATEIATNRMLLEVPTADVVIVNPTHYAVALRWDRSSPGAPVCVAKGVDAVAARIREIATRSGVPIHPDPPTARALHAATDLGQEIAAEHYAPVAAAIRFAETMRQRARARQGPPAAAAAPSGRTPAARAPDRPPQPPGRR